MVGYQDISVDRDGHHVHEGAGHVTVEEEGEDPAECGAKGPGLMDVSEQTSQDRRQFAGGYLEAVRGKLMAEKRRSEIARDITKAVVA